MLAGFPHKVQIVISLRAVKVEPAAACLALLALLVLTERH